MVQSGDWPARDRLTPEAFRSRLVEAIHSIDMNQARREVAPFVAHPEALPVWSVPFFIDVASRTAIPEDWPSSSVPSPSWPPGFTRWGMECAPSCWEGHSFR
jgi:hypothetical protein